MPVYERGYKHWERSERRASPPWWVIARRGIAEPLKRRGFLLLIVLSWSPAVIKGGILYFKYKFGQLADLAGGDWTAIDAGGIYSFLKWQKYFVLILLAIVGTRLIAKDRLENGLALYFARPLTLKDYVAGKMLIILFYFFMVTLFPLYALSLFGYLVTSGQAGLDMLLLTPLRATVFCGLAGASMSLILLALSAMGLRAVFITVGWVLLYLGSEQIANILVLIKGGWMRVIDFPAQYFQAGAFLFGARTDPDFSPWVSALLLAAYTAAACWVLRRRIRPVEVVS
jgi:ABC-type transport system involved in multi-copper enzyme maturation permease subunit